MSRIDDECTLCNGHLEESGYGTVWVMDPDKYPEHVKCRDERIRRMDNRLCVLCGAPYGDSEILDGFHKECSESSMNYQGYGA